MGNRLRVKTLLIANSVLTTFVTLLDSACAPPGCSRDMVRTDFLFGLAGFFGQRRIWAMEGVPTSPLDVLMGWRSGPSELSAAFIFTREHGPRGCIDLPPMQESRMLNTPKSHRVLAFCIIVFCAASA